MKRYGVVPSGTFLSVRAFGGVLSALLLVMCLTAPASAQITTGSVSGTIKDEQGLPVPGATVTLLSEARGTRTPAVFSNGTGVFVVPNVTPDTYTVEVALTGFKTLKRAGVAVSGGDRVGVGDLTIAVGGTSETVTVTSEAPIIQSQSGERSFSITNDQVANLPIPSNNGRSFSSVTSLTPGVLGNNRLGGGGQNNIMMDGVSTMDTGNNGQLLNMTPEAIAEVKVLTSGYQAEYGRSSGLQITAVTKSGTNTFRGSVYDLERNSDWNSNSWANKINGAPKAVDQQRDWGYTFGGPIGKPGGDNKLFFFYSQEYRPRRTANTVRQFRVPTLAERNGDFSASLDNNGAPIPALKDATTGGTFSGNKIPADRLYQPGLNILRMYPEPNITQATGTSYNLDFLSPEFKTLAYQPAIRGDYQASSSLRITAKYTGQKNFRGTTPGSIPGFNDTFNAYPWVNAFATTVNYTLSTTTFFEGTYGYSNRRLGGIVNSDKTNKFNTGLGGLPMLFPNANILPVGSYNERVLSDVSPPFFQDGRAQLAPTFSWGGLVGSAPPNLAYPNFLNTNPTQDVSISMTKVQGRHSIKTGFYSNHSLKQQNLNQRNALPFQGDLSFANATTNPLDTGYGFANAALGVFTSYTQQSSFVEGKFVYNQIEAYVQDNWKVNGRLTLDYGVRFTYQQPQYDANGQASNFFQNRFVPSQAPAQYQPGCPNNVFPCETTRQALNPVTGQLMGSGTAALIGQIVPGTGSPTNGIVQAGKGISKYNYEWPTMAVAPRFGFAYDVSGAQSMVVRGGFGLFYDRPAGDSIYYQSQNPPTSTNQTVRNGRLQDLASGSGVASSGVPTIINYRYENDSLPASFQWNGGLQLTLPWSSALDISYVGQHSYAVLNLNDGNGAVNVNAIDFGTTYLPGSQDPTRSATVAAVPGNAAYVAELLRPFRGYGNIDQQWQAFQRTYHSLQFSANRRLRNGLSFGGNYTLGISDKGTTSLPGTPVRLDHKADGSFVVRADQEKYEKLMEDVGLQRHVIKLNFVWDLPNMIADGGAMKAVAAVVNDWQVSGIYTGGSGSPYDVSYTYQSNGANVHLTGSPDYAARTVINGDTGSGCSSDRFKQFTTSAFSGPLANSLGLESGRNYLVGCADKTTDLSITRSFPFGRGRSAQLRLDMFNAFNAVVFNNRVSQLQLVSPTNQTVRNPQYLADGSVDPAKVKTTAAGFGAVTGARDLRAMQLQVRFSF